MKSQLSELLDPSISSYGVFIADAFKHTEEGHLILDIVLDSDEVIDLNLVTEVSRVINKILDDEKNILEDVEELDIYSKEKGED